MQKFLKKTTVGTTYFYVYDDTPGYWSVTTAKELIAEKNNIPAEDLIFVDILPINKTLISQGMSVFGKGYSFKRIKSVPRDTKSKAASKVNPVTVSNNYPKVILIDDTIIPEQGGIIKKSQLIPSEVLLSNFYIENRFDGEFEDFGMWLDGAFEWRIVKDSEGDLVLICSELPL
jgi:hypothetical protein